MSLRATAVVATMHEKMHQHTHGRKQQERNRAEELTTRNGYSDSPYKNRNQYDAEAELKQVTCSKSCPHIHGLLPELSDDHRLYPQCTQTVLQYHQGVLTVAASS
jgi:hypothetical protein